MARMRRLKIGEKVVASFLGSEQDGIVIEIVDKDTYKVQTRSGTILPSCMWEKKAPKNKKGKITSPWYIVKLGTKNNNDE